MLVHKTDLGLVVKEFTDSYGDTHKELSVKRYNYSSEDGVTFNGIQYYNGLNEVRSIQSLVLETFRENKIVTKTNRVLKTRLKEFLNLVPYGSNKVAYIPIKRDLVNNSNFYLGIGYNDFNQLAELIQNYVDSNDPHLHYGVRFSIHTSGIPIVYNTFIANLDLLAKIK